MSSPTQLRVAVITPYYLEPLEVLRNCYESVLSQTFPCTHFMVADGHPCEEVSSWAVEHIILPKPHHDLGNTARGRFDVSNESGVRRRFLPGCR